MEVGGIVPNIVDKVSSLKLSITYSNNKQVDMGKELTPTEVKDEPKVSWQADSAKFYTLVMVDPDAPSRAEPQFGDVKHWLVVNIQGNDLSTGKVIAHYGGSGPPQGTGLHRYIFFVYEEGDKKVSFDEPLSPPNSIDNRLKWSLRKFSEKYGLGNPIGGNYFQAQWDEYCDELRKKFGR